MEKIVLDTNAYSRLLSGDERVLDTIAKTQTVYVSTVVLGELIAGFIGGGIEEKNRNLLNRFLSKPGVKTLAVTSETSEFFGMVKNSLKRQGTPIPINDVWIAAHALETGAVLVTYDAHFKSVPGLRIWPSATQ